MSTRIGLRTAEALVEGDLDYLCAEPEIIIGELDGPVGTALATLLGDQVKGHTRVFAILNSDVQVKPATLMVSKVTVESSRYTGILMGSVQAGIANVVLDAMREGTIPKDRANDLGIIYSIWLDPAADVNKYALDFPPKDTLIDPENALSQPTSHRALQLPPIEQLNCPLNYRRSAIARQ